MHQYQQGMLGAICCCLCGLYSSLLLINHSHASSTQCFSDATSAYKYLEQTTSTHDISNHKQAHLNARDTTTNQLNNSTKSANPIYLEQAKSSATLIKRAESTELTAQKININRASEAQLVQLKGIGSKRAQDIILYREMMGGFVTVDDLANIKGIGTKTIEKNRHRLSVVD